MSFEFPGPDEVRCSLCQCLVKESATVLVRQRTMVKRDNQVLGMSTLPVKACPPCARTNGTVVPASPTGRLQYPDGRSLDEPLGLRTSAKILQFRRKDDQ